MAADRQRLAAALAYEEERRRRMMESVPTTDNLPPVRPARSDLRTNLENLSSGLGQGIVNQLEGVKTLVTDPVGTARATYEGVKGIVRDPSVVADALRYTADKAMSGPLGAGEVVGGMLGPMRGKGPMAEIDVYHGSPHVFDEFDASKIGTGEGAQAYGRGIYFAESPNVAKYYATGGGGFVPVQSKDNVYFNGQWVQDFSDKKSPEGLAKYAMSQSSTGATIKEKVETLNKIGRKDAADWLEKNADKFTQSKGNLYTADLPDEMVDRMIDYDLPIDQQSPYVLAALDRAGINTKSSMLAGLMAQGQEKHLTQFGIPGIKYMDEGSRGYVVDLFHKGKPYAEHSGVKHQTLQSAQERIAEAEAQGFEPRLGTRGTRNFVVFPGEEKKVKILRRE